MMLTPENILGVNELQKAEYTIEQKKAIELTIYQFAQCKNEDLSKVAKSWINEFAELNMPYFEVIKRIRLAKHEKKYGNTEFAIFMNINLDNYSELYRHKAKAFNEN